MIAQDIDDCEGNLGSILKVNTTHKNQKAITKEADDHLWAVTATHPMTYAMDVKLVRKRREPDSSLRPIRGVSKDIQEVGSLRLTKLETMA